MAFDSATRNTLAHMVTSARTPLVEEFTKQLQESYGIQPDGSITELENLTHLDDEQRGVAGLLRERIGHLASGLTDEKKPIVAAIDRMTREQAFTVLNRFAALRMCEERKLVKECVGGSLQSRGFQVFLQIAGFGLGDHYDRYHTFLNCLFDEIAIDLGVLFDRFSPYGLLFPREPALLELLNVINDEELKHVWAEDETIGWIYQYFNPKEERDAMRKASRSPQNTRELAVRNQFFTPRYVVEFLTDNTLGRIWYEMRKGETTLKDVCRYIVRRPNEVFLAPGEKSPVEPKNETDLSQEELLQKTVHIEHRPKKDPRDLRVLDPACGSGHFLLYAFDLLEQIYKEAWQDSESPKCEITGRALREDFETLEELRQAVPKLIIEHNLHGIDIDARAVQIAALVLWLRAQKSWETICIKAADRPLIAKTNLVTAEPMPGDEDMRREFTDGLKPRVLGQLVDVVFDKMKLAGEAGSLLKIEDEISDAIVEAKRQWVAGPKPEQQVLFQEMKKPEQIKLFDVQSITDESFWDQAEDRILDKLKDYAEWAENGHTIRRRLFAEDTARGFAFIDLCRNRYDAILMNPPFGASSLESKEYIEGRYPRTKGDVLANFIERALHLIDERGRVGAISSRTPFFLGSFETLRAEVLGRTGNVCLLADLGEGVLEAMVETAIYVMTKYRGGETTSLFFRLLVDMVKDEALNQLTTDCCQGLLGENAFVINAKAFDLLHGRPYTYWVSPSIIRVISKFSNIEGTLGVTRVGMQTGDDRRFLRLIWEVPISEIWSGTKYLRSETHEFISRLRDAFYTKNKRWAFYSKTDMASPWFSPLSLVVNWMADGRLLKEYVRQRGYSPSKWIQSEGQYFQPGFSYMLRSTRLVPYLVPSGVIPTAGRAQIFPEKGQEYAVLGICASNVGSAIARFSGEMFARPKFQASMVQGLPACDFPQETLARIKEHVDAEVNKRRVVVQRYEPFQEFTLPAWIQTAAGGETTWDLYSLFGRALENKIAEAFGLNSEQLVELERDIREAISIREQAEDVESEDADEDSTEDEHELNIELISETPEEKAVGFFMYAVGVVMGRWDIRFALDNSPAPKLPDPFDPLPVCPPGMLVGHDGLPAEPGGIVSEEWLRARPDANTLPLEGAVKNSTIPDSEYPLCISWDGILVDDLANQTEDIVNRVREVLEIIWKDKSGDIEQEACEVLGVGSLQDYYHNPNKFFADHLKRYSKSHRRAPIYWPLSTASGSYTLWVYYHRLTDQTLFTCVNDYVNRKIDEMAKDIERLQRETGTGGTTKQRQELEKLHDFRSELEDFRDELLRVTKLPYKPNLNDGVLITASPLWKLFRHNKWSKDLKACWEKLEKGEYDWAHMAYSIWPDRVKDKCKKDRSLAIGHSLENLYEV